jgi:hypothetical protein
MSCAVFTFIGGYAAYANKSNGWIIFVLFSASWVLLSVAGYLAWRDEHLLRLKEMAESERLRDALQQKQLVPAATPPVQVHISGIESQGVNEPPRLGMRAISIFDSAQRGISGPTIMNVEFRLCLLSGRPATSISIQPVYSRNGYFSIHFGALSYVRREEQTISFEIRRNEKSLPRNHAGIPEWGMGDFLWNSGINGGIETSPIVVNFRDGDAYLEQRFRMTFDFNTRVISIIDEYPEFVLQNSLDNVPLL